MKFEIYHATYYKILFILKHMLCNLIEFILFLFTQHFSLGILLSDDT
jgi:hypothetical protein